MVDFKLTASGGKGKKGDSPSTSRWARFGRGFKTFRTMLPGVMYDTLELKGKEIVTWLEEDQKDLTDVYSVFLGSWSKGHELQIHAKTEFADTIRRRHFGHDPRSGSGPKPIHFSTPQAIARVLGEMMEERAAWEAQGGYAGTGLSNPFSKAAEDKLLREGVIIRRGTIAGSAGTWYITNVVNRKLPKIEDNFRKAIIKTWKKSFRGVRM